MKDGHLNIIATNSINGYDLKQMTMRLPLSFIIKDETLDDDKIYIQKYEDSTNSLIEKFKNSLTVI